MFTYVSIGWNGYSAIVINEAMPISYEDLVSCVGGYIEFIYLNDGMVLVVNEEGLILNLPYNERATNTALAEGKKHNIVGDVLLIGTNFIK